MKEEKTGACFWGHKWSKWEEINTLTTTNRLTEAIIGEKYIFKRECLRCGYSEFKKKAIYY